MANGLYSKKKSPSSRKGAYAKAPDKGPKKKGLYENGDTYGSGPGLYSRGKRPKKAK